MSTKSAQLRAESHNTIGTTIVRDAGVIISRWARRAVDEQPTAKRVHHETLIDHLPTFLWELGRGLSETASNGSVTPHRTPPVHGDQRWETGWSVDEVVRDYQILRIVITEHLDDTLDRPLSTRELLALGVYIDDAIASSVATYVACQKEADSSSRAQPQPDSRSDSLLGVLAVLGHELRNPLAPLGNAIEILKLSPTEPAAVQRAAKLMDRQQKAIVRLVDDLLDFPRLARGKMPNDFTVKRGSSSAAVVGSIARIDDSNFKATVTNKGAVPYRVSFSIDAYDKNGEGRSLGRFTERLGAGETATHQAYGRDVHRVDLKIESVDVERG